MNERRLRAELREAPVPGAEEAQARSWLVVHAAYGDREPARRRPPLRAGIAVGIAAVLALAIASPPGRAVIDSLREAIGVEHAQPALFSLPASGRLLAAGEGGAWVIAEDGSRRRLGDYREASWSPFGRFVVAVGTNELAALEPDGGVRWTLARPAIRFARWGGSRTDTRIAYLTGSRLHVVAGDGTGDRDLGLLAAAPVAPAWRPAAAGRDLVLAYADTRGRVRVVAPDSRAVGFATAPGPVPTRLEWSSDGRRLLAASPRGLRVYDASGRVVARRDAPAEERELDATFLPGTHELAALRTRAGTTDAFLPASGRVLFRTRGPLTQLVASPDGRFLLVAWPAAGQWVFVPVHGGRMTATGNIAAQLGGAFPAVGGWCCATTP